MGRLGIDFGTSNTVLAVWDETQREGIPLHVPDYARVCELEGLPPPPGGAPAGRSISVIPSLIHYAADRRRWLGNQVLAQNLYQSERTFRWMKRFIAHRSPAKVRLDGRELTHLQAGRDFLSAVLTFAATELNLRDEAVAFTLPVEAYEHYENWLAEVAEQAGLPRFRLLDEPSAAALGYGAHVQPGHVYLIFDFGGGTLDVAVVQIEEEQAAPGGRRCRVLGKAGADLGGATIDQWLYEEVLRRNGRSDADEQARQLSRALLVECEGAKERLSTHLRAGVTVLHPHTGAVLAAEFTQEDFEQLLDEKEALTRIDQTVRRALNAAQERGYAEADLQAVLMVGGSSLIPAVQRTLQRMFGRHLVKLDRPLDAVARGAAAFVAGVDFYDHIQHDYAIRYVNPQKGDYDYRVIVQRGTPYPTKEPLARLIVKASYDRQEHLGLALFELGEPRPRGAAQPVELVFDPSGAARIMQVTPEEEDRRVCFWLNENSPTFLRADPPALKGERRFEVLFAIDGNKRLLITARDLKTDRVTHRDFPVVKLS
jgi:molecular chaperone DnaK (HSP70)